MRDSTFRFRQFSIHQDKCAMKVGTDGVLLGSWVDPGFSKHILDIGTGTGLIALMLAQKSNAEIDAVEIEENAFEQAKENFEMSPWRNRIRAYHLSFQEFSLKTKTRYDLIVSNPPYFHHASKPCIEARLNARHNDQLSFDQLIAGVKRILAEDGKFCVILPSKEGLEFMDLSQRNSLFCHEMIRVKTKADKCEKRLMMKFRSQIGLMHDHEIIIQEEDSRFTDEYLEMTRDYFIGLK
jgi:tRNA1Val (adenine37-N6)-methyltransferase